MNLLVAVTATAALTGLLVVIALNFVTAERRLHRPPPRWYGSTEADFRRSTGVLLGPAILPGNSVQQLVDGDEIFPAMLAAIDNAQRSICFETFIYWSGEIGDRFSDSFESAARRGVRVHILFDWLGTRQMDAGLQQRLRSAGIEVQIYHPLSWYHIGRMNNRTHRRLLVVDGSTGFTGGVGIAPQWTGNAQDADHWRDSHFRVTGPVVAQMQAVFLDNWIKSTGEVLHGDDYFPALPHTGETEAQMFGSSATGGSDSMHLMFMLAITSARRSIDIVNAYFVPDDLTMESLVAARHRGVTVRVLLPGPHMDVPIVRQASHANLDQLLTAGVQIFEFLPTMLHCKAMIVDGSWVTVGSANFDSRSFRLNDEANLNAFSETLALQLTELFEADLARSRRFVRRSWRRRSYAKRTLEWLASRLDSQL